MLRVRAVPWLPDSRHVWGKCGKHKGETFWKNLCGCRSWPWAFLSWVETVCLKDFYSTDVNLQLIRGNTQIKDHSSNTLRTLGESGHRSRLSSSRGRETLTLQEVGRQEGGRGVRAGQALLQEVSLQLQGEQVPRREFKTPQVSAPKALEQTPTSPSQDSTGAPETAVTSDTRIDREQRRSHRWPFAGSSSAHSGVLRCSPPRRTTPLRASSQIHVTSVTHTKLHSMILLWKCRNIQFRQSLKRGYGSFRLMLSGLG